MGGYGANILFMASVAPSEFWLLLLPITDAGPPNPTLFVIIPNPTFFVIILNPPVPEPGRVHPTLSISGVIKYK